MSGASRMLAVRVQERHALPCHAAGSMASDALAAQCVEIISVDMHVRHPCMNRGIPTLGAKSFISMSFTKDWSSKDAMTECTGSLYFQGKEHTA
eukprot:2098113-Amphidinium_carterae.1